MRTRRTAPTSERWSLAADEAERRPPDTLEVRTRDGVETWTPEADEADRRPAPEMVVRSAGRSALTARMRRVIRTEPLNLKEQA